MSWIDDIIRDFGSSMGLENLALNEKGVLCLTFERTGNLFIEQADDAMLIYLVREIPPYTDGVLSRALTLCHYRENYPLNVHTALKDDNQLVFLVRMSEREVSLPVLEQTINLLSQLHDKALAENVS